MTVYDMNQQEYAQMKTYEDRDFVLAKDTIDNYVKDKSDKYYMLLNNDLRYYTLFTNGCGINTFRNKLSKEVIDIVKPLGEVKSIELNEGLDVIEIWIIPNFSININAEDDELSDKPLAHCFMLFPYDRGVVTVE